MDNISWEWFGNCTRSIQAWITFEAAHFENVLSKALRRKYTMVLFIFIKQVGKS
jgi:hypothetical protein